MTLWEPDMDVWDHGVELDSPTLARPSTADYYSMFSAFSELVHQHLAHADSGGLGRNDGSTRWSPGRRASRFRGITKHKRTQRYEAHVWECKKQVYLGGFLREVDAAMSHDIMSIRCKGPACLSLNFGIEEYESLLPYILHVTREDIISVLRAYSRSQVAAEGAPPTAGSPRAKGVKKRSARSTTPRTPRPRQAVLGRGRHLTDTDGDTSDSDLQRTLHVRGGTDVGGVTVAPRCLHLSLPPRLEAVEDGQAEAAPSTATSVHGLSSSDASDGWIGELCATPWTGEWVHPFAADAPLTPVSYASTITTGATPSAALPRRLDATHTASVPTHRHGMHHARCAGDLGARAMPRPVTPPLAGFMPSDPTTPTAEFCGVQEVAPLRTASATRTWDPRSPMHALLQRYASAPVAPSLHDGSSPTPSRWSETSGQGSAAPSAWLAPPRWSAPATADPALLPAGDAALFFGAALL